LASRKGFPSRRGQSLSRRTGWEEGPLGVISASAIGEFIFPTAQIATGDGFTLIRTRGDLLVKLDVAADVLSRIEVSFGMCIVSENAAGIGATAVPFPGTDIAWEGWFVYTQFVLAGTIDMASGASTVRYSIDSKAMRKLGDTDVVIACIQFRDEIGSVDVKANLVSRMLFKLP